MTQNHLLPAPIGEIMDWEKNIGGSNADKVNEEAMTKYLPQYTDNEKATLKAITDVCTEEIRRVQNDEHFHATIFADGTNCLIDLRKAYENGIEFATPVVNRTHGKDLQTTGESLLTYGAQHPLIIITTKMADASGMDYAYFDKQGKPTDGLVFIDGNGRACFLLSRPVDQWPNIYAVFPCKDSTGYYNIPKSMEIINTQVTVWKTQDMVQKRLLEEGKKAHEGWAYINSLVKKGYKYQAACQLATLKNDRIHKSDVTTGDASSIFDHFESAKTVHMALVAKFGEGADQTIKTKTFTQTISTLWAKLQKVSGDSEATKHFVCFINGLSDDIVTDIKTAKTEKTSSGKISKDEKRKAILEREFYQFVAANNIKV